MCDFVARRPFVPVLGLGIPVTWRSRTWHEPATRRLRFVHVAGATRGMDVTWTIEPARRRRARGSRSSTTSARASPGFAAFVDRCVHPPIAGRTLATFRRSPRRSRPTSRVRPTTSRRADRPPRASDHRHRRASPPIGTGCRVPGGPAAGASPVKRIDRFDPSPFRSQVAAQIDDFDPLDHMDARTARGARPVQPVRPGGRADGDGRRGLVPGRGAAPRAERIGIYLGSALGGIAFAEEQHEQYLERGMRSVSPTLALAVFGGAAPANLGIALDVRGPILSTANSCARGAVAIGEALDAIRDGEIDAAIAGGVEVPAVAARVRRVRHHPGPGPRPQRRPGARRRGRSTRDRDGFVMGEGAALLVLEAADVAGRAARDPTPRCMGYGATSDAHHMVQPRPDGREAGPRRHASRSRTPASRRDEIDWVSAHARRRRSATSPRRGRSRRALGERAATVPVSRDEGA